MQWCPVDICTRGAWGAFLVASKADLPRLRKDVSHDIPAVTTLMLDMDSIISVLNHRSPIFGEDTWHQYPRMVGLTGVFMCRDNASRTACHFGVLELWAQMDSIQMTLFGHIFRAHGVPSRWRPVTLIVSHPGGLSHRDTRWETARSSGCTGILGELCWRCAMLLCSKLCLSLMFAVWCWK